MNTLIIAEAELIIKDDATAQLRISAVLLRKAGRLDVPYTLKLRREKILMIESILETIFLCIIIISLIKAWTKKYDFDKKTYPVLKLRKSGTAKLTLTYKSGSKRYNYTVKVQVIKYQNPFKTFKIGNKNYASVYNKVNMYGATLRMPTLKNGTYKFALKPNKNFTINTAKLQQTYGNTARNVNIKNAKKVKITKDAYFMFMMKYKNMDIVNVCFQG